MKPPQEDGVNRHQIASDHTLRVRAQELAPAGTPASPGGPQPVPFENPADGGCSHPVAELAELSGDAQVSPTTVIARHLQDQVLNLGADLGPAPAAGATAEAGPTPPDKLPVPTEKGRGRDQQAPLGEEAGQGREYHPVGVAEVRSLDGPAEHGDLMPQRDHFDLELADRADTHDDQADQDPKQPIDEGEEHRSRR